MSDPKDFRINDTALTTTPGHSSSQTVAKGSIAELAARDPALAAELNELGTKLKNAGVRHVPDTNVARG